MAARHQTDYDMAITDARTNIDRARYEHDNEERNRCLDFAEHRLRDAERIRQADAESAARRARREEHW